MQIRLSPQVLFFCLLNTTAAAQGTYNILDFGAKADGQTLATAAIQSAIDKAASSGGGIVVLPAGKFLSGTIRLKSNVNLHLDIGCVLLGSTDIAHYPDTIPAIRSYTDNYVRQSLIYGENLSNIAITGEGAIDGQGAAFKVKDRNRPYENRPYILRLINCREILIDGLRLQNSAMWMQHYLACERLTVRGLRVINHVNSNNDGIDIDGCRDVTLSDCIFDSEDDAITLKSTLDKPTESVAITNCIARSTCSAIKMGTESNGGFRDITISNCVVTSSRIGSYRGLAGIALELVDGGQLDNIALSNIIIKGVSVPIFMRLGNRARPFKADSPAPPIGSFKNVSISNVIATDVSAIGCSFTGQIDHPIENITLSNIRLSFEGGGKKELASKDVPEFPQKYPECTMFGDLPAYGLFIRHAKNLKLEKIVLQTTKPDLRHAVICDDVENLSIDELDAPIAENAAPIFRFINVRNALIRGCRPNNPNGTFLQLAGGNTRDITLLGNVFTRIGRTVQATPDVPASSWSQTANTGAQDR